MISIAGIRFFIEFSSILVLAFLCIMHEFTDVTWAKQFNFDHASTNQQHPSSTFDDVESVSIVTTKKSLNHHQANNNNDDDVVQFSPKSLNFGHHSIGMPIIKTVHVYNNDDENDLQLISISGNTEHFHCSFFEEKILPSKSNTSFQIAFLARQEGLVNNTLYIHSSAGTFHYHVSAFGEISPFRVRPLIGARVPLNSSFASLIYIYNPFSTPLQLTEMYTSGGGLHLELLNDDFEAPSSVWEVPPFETRPVMRAHFVTRIASNHTSYIRIRTNKPEIQLMLPVEVEVSNSPGLYSPLDTLDFGVLRAKHDPPKTLPIQVINAAQKSVSVQSIVVTPISDGLTVIDFSGPVKLPPHSSNPFHVGKLVVDPSQFSCSGLCLGKVLIKSKNNQYKLIIPFIVRVIQGELHFNNSQFHFFMNQSSNNSEQRVLNVENRFDSPIIVHDIVLPDEAKPYFHLTVKQPNSLPVTLPVGQSFPLLKIEFTPSPQLSHFSTVFRLLTNISYFDLPLYAYQGRLDLFIPNSSEQSKLDMGLIGLNHQKTSTFVVANHNPIAIRLIYWHCNITGISVEFVGTSQGNISAISQRIDASIIESSSREELRLLEPNHVAVFRVHADKLSKEGLHNGIISILTEYEKLTVPLTIKVLNGNLQAEQLIMPKTFPGKIVKSTLNIKSNYSNNIKIKGAFIEPKDDRFKIKLIDQLIKPGQDNQIMIIFDSSAACFQKLCYTALDVEKEVGHLWLLGSGLYSDTAYIDKELYKLLRNQWLSMTEADRNPIVNVKLLIDGFGTFNAPVQAQQHWPRLANKLIIRFPSIRIGQKMTKELLIENSADRQVLVQAINVIDYPNSEILLQLTSSNIFHQQWSKSDLQAIQLAIRSGHNRSVFSLQNNTIASNSQVQRITEWLGVEPNANSYIMLLPPGVRHRLAVTFNPLDEKNYTSLLILRNNLTIIDVVMLRGEGGRGLLKIGKILPNSSNSRLVFDFPERTLERRCKSLTMEKISSSTKSNSGGNSKSNNNYNTLVMRERFKAVNIGRMELQIRKFLIDGMPCEGHGFRITRCEPILLQPNQTFDIEILYSPDFTQHSIIHELTIIIDDESFSAQKFFLVAKIPSNLLKTCLDAIPRPVWEPHLYYILVMMALFVLILSMIVAVFDGHRITLNYYNSKYEFLNKKHDDDNNSGGIDEMSNLDGFKCQETSNNTTDSSGKKISNGTTVTNGSVMNGGGKNNYSAAAASNQKVRNRRGANKQNNNNNVGNNHQQTNGSVQKKNQWKTSSDVSSIVKSQNNESSKSNSNNNMLIFDNNNEYYSPPYNPSWNHLSQSSEFIRQDSSSSENSNKSVDSSSNGKMTKTSGNDAKKSSNDSLNEATATVSNNNSENNSPNSNRSSSTIRKSNKLPPITTTTVGVVSPPLKQQEQSNNKNSENSIITSGKSQSTTVKTKQQSTTATSQTKSTKQTNNKNENSNNKKDKSSKFNLNTSVTELESLKATTESSNNSPINSDNNKNDDNNDNFIPKTRSATMPLNLNHDSHNDRLKTGNNLDSFYVSEMNIPSCFESSSSNRSINNTDQDQRLINNNKMDVFQTGGGRMDSISNTNNNNKPTTASTMEYFGYFEPNNLNNNNNNNKDIWDSPITSFDTEMAMSELVKQTEEFASGTDDKTTSVMLNRSLSNTGIPNSNYHQNRRYERNMSSSKFNNTIVDDKWEIGEWSNDLLLNRGSSSNKSNNNNSNISKDSSKHFCNPVNNANNNNNINFGSFESTTTLNNMKKYRFSPSTTVNYQEYRNSLNDNNNSSRFLKSSNKIFNINDPQQQQQPKPISPPLTSPFVSSSNSNSNIFNSSLSSALNVSSLSSVTSLSTTTTSPSMINTGVVSNTTFSPVIGRPATASQQQQQPILPTPIQQRSKLGDTNLSAQKTQSSFNQFDGNFSILNNKSLSLDLPTFNNPSDHGKTFLDSLLDNTQKPPAFNQTTSNNNGLGLSNTVGRNNDNIGLGSLSLLPSETWDSNTIPEFPLDTFLSSTSSQHHQNQVVSKPSISSNTGLFSDLGNDNSSLWSPSTSWSTSRATNIVPKTSDIFSQFSTPPIVSSLSNEHSTGSVSSNNWPMSSSSIGKTSNTADHHRTQSSGGNSVGAVWSPFDSFSYGSNFNGVNSGELSNINNNNNNKMTGMRSSPTSPSLINNRSLVGSPEISTPNPIVFELFGKSPWTPIGSSPPNSGGNSSINSTNTTNNNNSVHSPTPISPGNNFLSPTSNTTAVVSSVAASGADSTLFGRFSQNSSPSSSSASSGCVGGGVGGSNSGGNVDTTAGYTSGAPSPPTSSSG